MCTISSPADDANTTATTTASPHSRHHSLHSEGPTGATQAHYSTLSPQATMLLKLSKRTRNNAAYQQYKAHTQELSNRDTTPTTTMHSETDMLGAHELKMVKSNHYSQFRYQPNRGKVISSMISFLLLLFPMQIKTNDYLYYIFSFFRSPKP